MSRHLALGRIQRGYLMEIPVLLLALGLVLAIVLPMLPPIGQKIVLGLAVILVLFCLYYMIVVPGWTPGDSGRLKAPWNMIVFVLVAGVIVFGTGAFLLGG